MHILWTDSFNKIFIPFLLHTFVTHTHTLNKRTHASKCGHFFFFVRSSSFAAIASAFEYRFIWFLRNGFSITSARIYREYSAFIWFHFYASIETNVRNFWCLFLNTVFWFLCCVGQLTSCKHHQKLIKLLNQMSAPNERPDNKVVDVL